MARATGCSSICCRRAGPASRPACRARWSRSSPDAPTRPSAWRGRSSRSRSRRKIPAVRVRVAAQPTFTRYIFELPELTGVTAERGKDKLTLTFAKPLRFDLSDAKLASAKAVAAVDAGGSGDTSEVQFKFSQAGRHPHLPRGFELRRRRQSDRRQAPAAGSAAGPLAGIARAAKPCRRKHRAKQADGLRRPTAPPAAAMPKVAADEAAAGAAANPSRAAPARAAQARSEPSGDRRAAASGRQPAAVLSVRRADARRGVPARRHAVARVRHQGRASTSACSATTRARPSAAPRWRARTMRRSCASSSNGRAWSASSRRIPAGSSRSARRWRARPSR